MDTEHEFDRNTFASKNVKKRRRKKESVLFHELEVTEGHVLFAYAVCLFLSGSQPPIALCMWQCGRMEEEERERRRESGH